MGTSDSTPKRANGLLARDLVCAARYYSSGRRGILLAAALVGIPFSWNWLEAAGITPLLLTALPCLAMCGLGLCMNKLMDGSCESNPAQPKMTEPARSETATFAGSQDAWPTEQVRCEADAAPKGSSAVQSTERGSYV